MIRNLQWLSFIFVEAILIFPWLSASNVKGLRISKISTKTSTIYGSSMDQPSIRFFGLSNGGSYSLIICSGMECCTTGILDTKDNNWELGQVDWFVGRQIGSCSQFYLDTSQGEASA